VSDSQRGQAKWKGTVIGALSMPDIIFAVTPLPNQPAVVQTPEQQMSRSVPLSAHRGLFQIDKSLKELADYRDHLQDEQRLRGMELGEKLREPTQARIRPKTRDER
jgi:hypothetical protein